MAYVVALAVQSRAALLIGARGGGGSNFEGVQKSRDLTRDQKLVT